MIDHSTNPISCHRHPDGMITEWHFPSERFQSQYGVVTYGLWCEFEKNRIGDATVVVGDGMFRGMVCLVKNGKI